jgi:hypothetical protein
MGFQSAIGSVFGHYFDIIRDGIIAGNHIDEEFFR